MIDAKSLRIGNIVTIDNEKSWPILAGIPVVVISISQRSDPDFLESNTSIGMQFKEELYSQFNEFVCGIPLSEDILIILHHAGNIFISHLEMDLPHQIIETLISMESIMYTNSKIFITH